MSDETKRKMLEVSAILFKNNIPVIEARVIGQFIEELQQENQQLKERINKILDVCYGSDMTLTEYERLKDISEGKYD